MLPSMPSETVWMFRFLPQWIIPARARVGSGFSQGRACGLRKSALEENMPIYEYRCKECHQVFETWCKQIEDQAVPHNCPICKGAAERLISHTSFALKGSGWYATEYGSRKTENAAGKDAPEDRAATPATPATADAPASPACDSAPVKAAPAPATPAATS